MSDERRRDAELLEAWRGGDDRAGERLFDRYADSVARFFENKVREGADDLIQATFMLMLDSKDRVREARAFRAYVFGAARNILREHLRALARGRKIDPDVDCMAELAPGPSTVLGKRHEHRLLLEGLRRLSIQDQILLELSYWEGLDSAALGEILGLPASSVRSRLARTRERLKQALAELSQSPALLASTVHNLDDWAAQLREQLADGRGRAPR